MMITGVAMGLMKMDDNNLDEFPFDRLAQLDAMRTAMSQPSFSMIKMAAQTDIAIATLYNFRSGRIKYPRLDIFDRIVAYLSPRVVKSAPVPSWAGAQSVTSTAGEDRIA